LVLLVVHIFLMREEGGEKREEGGDNNTITE
jgi:hypothetical protein